MGRIRHIDWMKGIAILFMIQVHTAAVVPPTGIEVGNHPLAFLAAALGVWPRLCLLRCQDGVFMQVPLERGGRERRISWLIPRVSIFLCQILVNGLFHQNHGGRSRY